MNYRIVSSLGFLLFCCLYCGQVEAQYDDIRCKCVCPDVSVVNGTTNKPTRNRMLYIANVEQKLCNCENVVISQIDGSLNGKEKEFCPRCECKYQSRCTMTIKVVVIIVIWIISLLVVYMLFLMCLDPLLNKRSITYQEHTNEEVIATVEHDEVTPREPPVSPRRRSSSNMLNRVGHQQYKWKCQVQEQRRNIYDRHTMLN